ncbi:MAG: Do family serine endopeptidase [Bacteroidales bacterium]|nr:Do family serine endopeptidase [Bacteroidales bacterium]
MKARRFLGLFVVAVLGAMVAVIVYARLFQPETAVVEVPAENRFQYVNLPGVESGSALDFTAAVEQSIDAVVHVKTKVFRESQGNYLYEFFFGEQPNREAQPLLGFGSGVIISNKGYIVTNNHVIVGSDEVVVVLNNKREYNARVMGADPNTDLALLKIEAEGLSQLPFGDSDALRLGEWVLAIGNPYNLTSTVTAGIVSAKARNLHFHRTQEFSIESFIQTDAAVNPGNSGGALINTRGELVGINTAIASLNGAFVGYSFAIPVTIVEKVVKDLIEYGEVQRAILGVEIADVTAELAQEERIDEIEGVYVVRVRDDGAARQAGIREKDIIISIDDTRVNSAAELQEVVSRYRPGQKVKVVIKRDGKLKQFDLVLRNLEGSTEIVKKDDVMELLGASFEPLSEREKQKLGIRNGLKVKSVRKGKFMKVGIREGFVLTNVNKKPVDSVNDITAILKDSEGGVIIEGVDRNGSRSYYAFGM